MQIYVTVGYLRLDRNILLEDPGDREEIRLGARWRFARYWSVYGSTIVDLTSRREDPLTIADGFEPIRHRVGLAYEDECFEFGVTRSEEHTSELQSLMRISYAVFCLKKKKQTLNRS